jgi:rubrerythrin
MRTSLEWWNETKSDEQKLIAWLKKQYHGELTAAERIKSYIYSDRILNDLKSRTIFNSDTWKLIMIMEDEQRHAGWIGNLLQVRGVTPSRLEDKVEVYWDSIKQTFTSEGKEISTAEAIALAAHAERMRLERIRVIAHDVTAPEDIRVAFERILVDESWHAKTFKSMSTEEMLTSTLIAANNGRLALGLIPEDVS